jgi:hypothetical protein
MKPRGAALALACCALLLHARAAAWAADGSVPTEWRADADAASLLYIGDDAAVPAAQMPAIGNGYVATQIGSDAVYVSGVFNGHATDAPSHRARIPSPVNIRAPGTSSHAALHLREATYYRRSFVPPWKVRRRARARAAAHAQPRTRTRSRAHAQPRRR